MKLHQLKLKNFRCYKDSIEIEFDDLTSIIGKNDIGKSTIFDALDAFFNDNIDSGDLSNSADSDAIELTCIFTDIPEEIVLDTSEPTSPNEECILNSDEMLEIKRVYKFGSRVSKSTFIVAYHPTDDRLSDLLSLKNTPLKNKAEELGLDLSDINKSKNPPIRKKIRESINSAKANIELKVDGNVDGSDNLKTLWSALKKLLPIYSLFKVDKELGDKDKDIKDPMDTAIDEALALPEIQSMLEQVEDKVREYSTLAAENTIEKLKELDESLSENLKSEFSKSPTYNKIFDLKLLNENNIPLNKRGSGVRRLVLLSFFQAKAEKKKIDENAPSIIYAIEEPETSQHPNHQKLLIQSLIDLSTQENIQVFFTTHSANLVKEIPIESLRYISKNINEIKIETGNYLTDRENVISNIVKTLGILPNPLDKVKVLLYVEGNNDVNALKRYSKILHENDTGILNLMDNDNIGYVITGGGSLKHYINNKYLEGIGKPEVHIYDNDVTEYQTIVQRINSENNPRKKAFNTTKSELENYLHPDAIIEAYKDNGVANLTIESIEDFDDVPYVVAKALSQASGNDWESIPDEKKKDKADSKKKFLNTKAVELMTIDRISERNGLEEIKGWLETVNQLMELAMYPPPPKEDK